ncbi:MAG: Lrp/AsnC ligand binding domain-containing protein [Acidimicrobiia bacterium]
MANAYVLIQNEPARSGEVAKAIGAVAGVTGVASLVGPYDIIARIDAEDFDAISRVVLNGIQAVTGVTRTLTCPVAHF